MLTTVSRRDFLKGALIVSFSSVGPAAISPARSLALDDLDSWLAIADDGGVTAYSGKCDFGQGFATVQFQLVAEELGVPLNRITLVTCDTALAPDQGTTDGSRSDPTEFSSTGLRQALATAREALFRMAATKLNVSPEQLTVRDGVISMKTGGPQQLTYRQLIGGQQFHLKVNPAAPLKEPAQYVVLGTPVPRVDLPDKITGAFVYVQNVRRPACYTAK